MPSMGIAGRAGNVNADPAFPGPYCLTERVRDGDVVPGGEVVADDERNSPVTQRSGTQPAGENGRMGDRPTGTVNGVIPFRFDYTAISLANRSGLPLSRE